MTQVLVLLSFNIRLSSRESFQGSLKSHLIFTSHPKVCEMASKKQKFALIKEMFHKQTASKSTQLWEPFKSRHMKLVDLLVMVNYEIQYENKSPAGIILLLSWSCFLLLFFLIPSFFFHRSTADYETGRHQYESKHSKKHLAKIKRMKQTAKNRPPPSSRWQKRGVFALP